MNNKYAIGNGGNLIYRLSSDLKRFRKLTTNHVTIMGKNTHLEINKPLPNRINVVLSRTEGFNPEGVFVYDSLENALNQLELIKNDTSEVFVIGGEQLFKEALPLANKVYLTHIHDDLEGDTYFPFEYVERHFTPIHIESHTEDDLKFSFIDYVRKENKNNK